MASQAPPETTFSTAIVLRIIAEAQQLRMSESISTCTDAINMRTSLIITLWKSNVHSTG